MDFLTGVIPKESQAEKELKPLLMDDCVQVLSSFELNKIASLTYGDIVCEEIFELIEKVVSKPLDYSPLTIQKTLVVLRHILIFGSEKCVNSAYAVGAFVDSLRNFNTVLAAQQQQGALAFIQRIQGGGVDRGGPVRDAATAVHQLLKTNINELQRIRNSSASKESLVPVGNDKIAFITDEVRHYLLQKRIQEQERIEIKSNLAKSQGGFGGGYSAKDGKNVVGAAHGIEEMLKMAKVKAKFSDDGSRVEASAEEKILQELAEQARMEKAEADRAAASHNQDLLGSFNPSPANHKEIDLLDFSGGGDPQPVPPSTTADLTGGHNLGTTSGTTSSYSSDLLDLVGGATPSSVNPYGMSGGNAPGVASSSYGATREDPFSPASSIPPMQAWEPNNNSGTPKPPTNSNLDGISVGMSQLTMGSSMNGPSQAKTVKSFAEDRFAALDALAGSSSSNTTSLNPTLGDNRLLGFEGHSSTNPTSTSVGNAQNVAMSLTPSGIPAFPSNTWAAPSTSISSFSPNPAMVTPGSGQVAKAYGDFDESNQNEDNPWVMGGTAGSGLEPAAPAPGAPPPPPPPSWG